MPSKQSKQGEKAEIRLRPAYSWDCPNCGREVFTRGIVPDMSAESARHCGMNMELTHGRRGIS